LPRGCVVSNCVVSPRTGVETPGGSCDSLTCRRLTGIAASLYAEALIPSRTPAATAPMKIINCAAPSMIHSNTRPLRSRSPAWVSQAGRAEHKPRQNADDDSTDQQTQDRALRIARRCGRGPRRSRPRRGRQPSVRRNSCCLAVRTGQEAAVRHGVAVLADPGEVDRHDRSKDLEPPKGGIGRPQQLMLPNRASPSRSPGP